MSDKIICRGLVYQVSVGFHKNEAGILQRIGIDFVAEISESSIQLDKQEALLLDYDLAHQLLLSFLTGRHFNLIETIGDEVAQLLLEKFPIEAVTVTVHKNPLNMPTNSFVSFECRRVRKCYATD